MATNNIIRLKRGKEGVVAPPPPWVFSGAIVSLPDGIEEGDEVTVTDSDGKVLGTGHYQIGSIAVRILEFGTDSTSGGFLLQPVAERVHPPAPRPRTYPP